MEPLSEKSIRRVFFVMVLNICFGMFMAGGCSNFCQGADLKNQVDEKIKFNNSNGTQVNFSQKNGKISPAEPKVYKEKETTPLSFSADEDYFFIKWSVVDEESNQELSDSEIETFVEFGDVYSNSTTVTFKQSHAPVILNPVCAKRPKVVSATPIIESNGVYRDRRIVVMFDVPLCEAAIYYDEKEQEKLEAAGFKLLKDAKRDNRCYGYQV